MSVIQPRLQIPKMNIASPTNVPLNTNADPNIKIDGVNTLTRAAVTRIQYLSLFMVLTVPHTGQMSSPPLFRTFCLWSVRSVVQCIQDRLYSQGRGPRPTQITLTITKTAPGSFIGRFDFQAISTLQPRCQTVT